jgi:hypothetical protein
MRRRYLPSLSVNRGVAQVGNLLFRRLAVGRRLPICDTADCQSALPASDSPRQRKGILLGLFLATATIATATQPRLTSTTPSCGQCGTELELRLNGSRLDDAQEIVFYDPGIEVLKMEKDTNSLKAQIKIASDCRLGEHHLRVRAATGVSDLRTFFVSPFPVLPEAEPNNELAKAQSISLNSTVTGSITSEDVDCFVVNARQGQRLSAEMTAMRLGQAAFDPYMAIQDCSGAVLASSDDSSLLMQDPLISMLAPKDGTYVIQVRETSYGGNANFNYHLHVGDFPRPTSVYPTGGKAGETVMLKFLGDPGGEFSQAIKLPETPRDKFGVFAQQGGIAPSPNWIRISPFPNVLEVSPNPDQDPNRSGLSADRRLEMVSALYREAATPPVALNGIISQKGEADWFRFKAKKDQTLEVGVYARRLRSPLDSVLEIFDANGKSIASNDDSAGSDSYLKFTAPEDGEYLLRVKDQLGQGGVDYTYRVEITPVTPALTLSIPQVARYDSQTRQYVVVPRGNRYGAVISARRKDFSGDLAVSIEGLPAGLTLQADTMSSKVDALPLVFEATSDAKNDGKLLDLVAKSVGATPEVQGKFIHNVELVQGPNNSVFYATRADKLMVAVVEAVPFRIRIVEPKVPLVQNGTMDLKIVAERDAGFDEPINVTMLWKPPGVGALPDVTIAKGQTNVEYRLNANSDAQTRNWKIAVLGSATVNGGTAWVSSQLANLEVGTPYLIGKIDPLAASPGDKAKLVCKLEQKQPFEGSATVKLLGLPDKVTASEVSITKDSQEVVFELNIDPKISHGSHKALLCSVDIKKDSESIPHSIASGGILRIVPPKNPAETKVAAKKPNG